MISYPNKKQYFKKQNTKQIRRINYSPANRGMNLEKDINLSNDFYLTHEMCLITKRPTPINVVKVDYANGAKITDAYFEKQSTTDYNGVYKGRYIDFEAKSTISKTSFPLSNISKHQIAHLKNVIYHGGIAFFIIDFDALNETYFVDANYIINFINNEKRKSIPYAKIKSDCIKIKRGLNPRLDYLSSLKQYFKLA